MASTRFWTDPAGISLEGGGTIAPVTAAYETYGELSPGGDNAILVCHALTGDAHVASHHAGDRPGWWEGMVGPGLPLNTDEYFIICSNVLGGCGGTTGPATPGITNFPAITVGDMVTLQGRLLHHLGVKRLAAVVGGSLGGMQALAWAVTAPHMVDRAIVIGAPARSSAQSIAFNEVARQAIFTDPSWRGGRCYQPHSAHGDPADPTEPTGPANPAGPGAGPARGLAVARMLGMITYRSWQNFQTRFGRDPVADGTDPVTRRAGAYSTQTPPPFDLRYQVASYLHYHGEKLVRRFDARTLVWLTRAMDDFDISSYGRKALERAAEAGVLVTGVGIDSDILYLPGEVRSLVGELRDAGINARYEEISSPHGHDAFLIDHAATGPILEAALSADNSRRGGAVPPASAPASSGPTAAAPVSAGSRAFSAPAALPAAPASAGLRTASVSAGSPASHVSLVASEAAPDRSLPGGPQETVSSAPGAAVTKALARRTGVPVSHGPHARARPAGGSYTVETPGTLRLGLLGFGTVGTGVARLIAANNPLWQKRFGFQVELERVLVRDLAKDRPVTLPPGVLTDDPGDIFENDRIDLLVEVMGGVEPAESYVTKAMARGWSVVTANKELLARRWTPLWQRARQHGVEVGIEAAVAAGVPLLRPLAQTLSAAEVTSIKACLNGTCNFILRRMDAGGTLGEALEAAHELGYAEPDPSDDISGRDAMRKGVVLSLIAFGRLPASIQLSGIDGVTPERVQALAAGGKRLSLVVELVPGPARGTGGAVGGEIGGDEGDVGGGSGDGGDDICGDVGSDIGDAGEGLTGGTSGGRGAPGPILTVGLAELPESHPLARLDGPENAIIVDADPLGQVVFRGPGAGWGPTASAVMADVLSIWSGSGGHPSPLAVGGPMAADYRLATGIPG